ncbi:MAG: hypothetical protein O3A20_03260 [Planctomycetota bacterium]|nr:hypothetical protein [Planctomycetota bacterium]
MAPAKVKTTKNDKSVAAYLKKVEGADKRADAEPIVELLPKLGKHKA